MDSDNIVREVARFSNGFHNLVEELTKELDAHLALIGRLEARIIELEQKGSQDMTVVDLYCRNQLDKLEDQIKDLEQKGSQSVSIKIDGDIGERLDDIEQKIEALGERLDSEAHSEDDIREWAKDEAQEVLANASFSVTVD
jgi:BMFP domain-containing protein YqiC